MTDRNTGVSTTDEEETQEAESPAEEQDPGTNEPGEPATEEESPPTDDTNSPDEDRGQEDEAPSPANETPNQETQQTKVIISMKGSMATVGVKRADTDPFIEAFYDVDCLETALQHANGTVQRADRHWEANPRNPKYTKPRKRTNNRRNSATAANPANSEVESQDQAPSDEAPQTVQASLF